MPTIHSDIHTYLLQQRQMYGDMLYSENIPHASITIIEEQEEVRAAAPSEEPIVVRQSSTAAALSLTSIDDFNSAINECQLCPLGFTRKHFVFGSGNPNADLMIIGEAPGADEDEAGLPFVGRAGQLLTKILEAVEISRDEVYICNILKCRPPNNRKPLVSETDTCEPYLRKQIDLVEPRYILALGLTAANTLLKNRDSMSSLRGRLHDYHGIPTLVTYHPAALLRNPEWKKHTWEDVKYLKSLITNVT